MVLAPLVKGLYPSAGKIVALIQVCQTEISDCVTDLVLCSRIHTIPLSQHTVVLQALRFGARISLHQNGMLISTIVCNSVSLFPIHVFLIFDDNLCEFDRCRAGRRLWYSD